MFSQRVVCLANGMLSNPWRSWFSLQAVIHTFGIPFCFKGSPLGWVSHCLLKISDKGSRPRRRPPSSAGAPVESGPVLVWRGGFARLSVARPTRTRDGRPPLSLCPPLSVLLSGLLSLRVYIYIYICIRIRIRICIRIRIFICIRICLHLYLYLCLCLCLCLYK